MFLSLITLCAEDPVVAQAVNKSVSHRVGIVSILASSYEVYGGWSDKGAGFTRSTSLSC